MSDRPKVLAVDDSATIRKAMELVLDPADYELELAASGAEAVAKAKEFQPAVILLDFILPDMRGADVCEQLAADPSTAEIPIVLISAKGAEIRQAYDNIPSVVSYITKPFTPAGVTSVIDEAISSRVEVEAPAAEVVVEPTTPAQVEPQPMATNGSVEAAADDDYDEAEASEWEPSEERVPEVPRAVTRAGLEAMFETLRGSLEGVFVEEGETRAGAAADESMTHHELAARLARQVQETLHQTESGARFNLCSDGSIRSLDDSLLDAYRRFCRLLFRAARDGAVQNEVLSSNQPRVMFLCTHEGELVERFRSIAQEKGEDWTTALVSSNYRQLPLMTRVFGPTHIVVEAIPGNAVWDQLELVKQMPEGRRIRVIGVAMEASRVEVSDRDLFTGHGVETVLNGGAALPQELSDAVSPTSPRPAATERPGEGFEAPAPAY